MLTRNKQNGMGFWGAMVVVAVFGFFVIITFKLMPSYIEHAKVKTALDNIAHQPDIATMEKGQIKAAFERRFNIDDVNDIDLSKSLFVEKGPSGTTIRIAYEKKVPLAYNVTALIAFDDSAQAGAR